MTIKTLGYSFDMVSGRIALSKDASKRDIHDFMDDLQKLSTVYSVCAADDDNHQAPQQLLVCYNDDPETARYIRAHKTVQHLTIFR